MAIIWTNDEKNKEIDKLADAIIRHLKWRKDALDLKEERRIERIKRAYRLFPSVSSPKQKQ